MKNEITLFEHPAFGKVRVIADEATGEPWFVAKDVAEALGYSNSRDAIAKHCKHSSTVAKRDGGFLTIIPRGDVYRLVARSKLPGAERFESWIFDEVLIAIDDHGGYLTPSKVEEVLLNPDTIIKLATALKEEQEARKASQAKLAEASSKAQIVDATFANRNHQPLRLTEVVRKLDGVNTQATKRDLMRSGYLHHTAGQYRVRSQYRGPDKLFVEKQNPYSFKHDIYATPKGAALIARLYYEGNLTMKKGHTI